MENLFFSEKLKNLIPKKTIVQIPKQRGGNFGATQTSKGIEVDCLGTSPLLPWGVFDAIEYFLSRQPDLSAPRGDAMGARLGDSALPLDSIEGRIALFFGYSVGDTVFRRISPVANLLCWANLCSQYPGILKIK